MMHSQATNPEYAKTLNHLYRYSVPLVQPQALSQSLEGTGKKVYLLDTRSSQEYAVSHLPGAIFVDYDTFNEQSLKSIPKDAQVVVYCSVGYRSERIGEKMQQMGFKNVRNLYGGIFEWVNQEHPVQDEKGKPTTKVHTYNADWGKWLQKGQKVF